MDGKARLPASGGSRWPDCGTSVLPTSLLNAAWAPSPGGVRRPGRWRATRASEGVRGPVCFCGRVGIGKSRWTAWERKVRVRIRQL